MLMYYLSIRTLCKNYMTVSLTYWHVRFFFEFSHSRSSITVFDVILHTSSQFTALSTRLRVVCIRKKRCLFTTTYTYTNRYKKSCTERYDICLRNILHTFDYYNTLYIVLESNGNTVRLLHPYYNSNR
jgi:hypothetical protein